MLDIEKIKETMQKPRFSKMVARYQFLIENLHKVDISKHEVFQRTYNCFFQLRRNEEYRRQHFAFMEKHKANKSIRFQEILIFLSGIQDTVEASFASKMLSIINPDMPVLDSKVLFKLGLKKPAADCPTKLQDTVELYNKICEWYTEFYCKADFKNWIKLFDGYYQNSGISAAKKVDFVLWQMDNE
ncbi:MAG: hypothetical protein FWE16_05255 [Firmicutes bacterium]|nr:hypothetical protein [Bacillota bacterium]